MEKLISDKSINYPFAVFVWVVTSLVFYFLCQFVDLDGKFWTILSFISGAIIAFGDRTQIPILTTGLLLFNKTEEVKNKDGNSVWLEPGMYFTFFIFSTSKKEHQKKEKQDVIVEPFVCATKSINILVEANGDWKISDDGHDKFKEQDESKMESNLESLVRRTLIRVCSALDFHSEIKGKDLGNQIRHDPIFLRECNKYGIEFYNLIVDAIPSDLATENLNAYSKQLFNEEKLKYPAGYVFSHKEIEEIEQRIQVRLKTAKKIITNSPLLGRYDVE